MARCAEEFALFDCPRERADGESERREKSPAGFAEGLCGLDRGDARETLTGGGGSGTSLCGRNARRDTGRSCGAVECA